MIALRQMSRFRAAAIHLAISAVIAAGTLVLMLALWYPPPLFAAMGGTELAVLIVGVDVAIGPLITLIIFDTRKKELAFDLFVIAVLQLAALGYGIYAMHAGRPVFTVFTEGRFAVVSAAEIDPEELAKGRSEEFRQLSLTGPRLVAAEPPTDPDELSTLAFMAFSGQGLQHAPKYYVEYAERRADVLQASRPIADLELNPADRNRLENYLAKSGHGTDALRCLPVRTKRTLLTALVDRSNGNLLTILDIPPTLRAD